MFTGLTREIGSPREFEKNFEDPAYFEKKIDIGIPHEETNELHEYFSKQSQKDRDVVSEENKTLSSSTNTRKDKEINSAGSEGEINQFDDTLMMQNGLAAKI